MPTTHARDPECGCDDCAGWPGCDSPIDFTFADDGDLVRKAPKSVPEDPVEKRLQQEREAAYWRVQRAIEVKHGSGKVKV
jgi:hypothetical protein